MGKSRKISGFSPGERMLEVARRADEARDTHTGVAHASTTIGVEDVRRFFQSPVDAASGTVVVVEYDRDRAAFSCYHHRAVQHPRSSFTRGRQSTFSVRVFARPSSRSIEPASGRGKNYGPRRIAGNERDQVVDQFSATRFTHVLFF